MRISKIAFLIFIAAYSCQRHQGTSVIKIHFTQNYWDEDQPWVLRKESRYMVNAIAIKDFGIVTHIGNSNEPQNFQYARPGHEYRKSINLKYFDGTTGLALFEIPEEIKDLHSYELASDEDLDTDQELKIEIVTEKNIPTTYTTRVIDSKLQSAGNNDFPLPQLKIAGIFSPLLTGEAVTRGLHLVGVISKDSDKETLMLPSYFIRSFLDAATKNNPTNFVNLGCSLQELTEFAEKKHFRAEHLKSIGALITDCPSMESFAVDKRLQAEDIVLSLNNHPISDDIKAKTPWGNLPLRALLATFSSEEPITAKIWRDGKSIEMTLEKTSVFEDRFRLIPTNPSAEHEHYLIIAGMVLKELTGNYFDKFKSPKEVNAPTGLYSHYQNDNIYQGHDKKRIVFLSDLLSDKINLGQRRNTHQILTSVNKIPIDSIAHLKSVLQENKEEFLDFEFSFPTDRKIFRMASLEDGKISLIKKYKIPSKAEFFP